jgi:hypothetical protein
MNHSFRWRRRRRQEGPEEEAKGPEEEAKAEEEGPEEEEQEGKDAKY